MERLDRRAFFREGLRQIAGVVGIGVGLKALEEVGEQKDSLALTDQVAEYNASVGNEMYRMLLQHETRLRQLEGKITPPQPAEGERRV